MLKMYQTHQKPEVIPAAREVVAPGPSLAQLQGGALPTPEQIGRKVDLPGGIRAKMEAAFGADLSGVALHESQTVADAGAQAMTMGTKIGFAPGQIDFTSSSGQALLGHELSHVVSQARGEVAGSGFLNDRALETRADREGAMAAAGEAVYTGPVTPISTTSSALSAAGPMQAKKPEKKEKVPHDEGYSVLDPAKAGKMNQDRDIGMFWQEHNNRGQPRPEVEGLHEELRQKYSGPEYKENMFNHFLQNADATVKGGGLNTSRTVATLSGETGKGVSADEMRVLYDRLMAGHKADVDASDPEAVQAANAEFDAGIRQLKGIYFDQLKRLRDNYGTMVTQMHPEDVLRQVGPNFQDQFQLMQDTEQMLVNMPQYFDMENNEDDQEFKRLSDYYNNAYGAMNQYANASFMANMEHRAMRQEDIDRDVGQSREYLSAREQEAGISGPKMDKKQMRKYQRDLRRRSKKKGWTGALFGHFK